MLDETYKIEDKDVSRHRQCLCNTKDFLSTTEIAKSNGKKHKEQTQIHLLVWGYYISKGALA